MAAMVDHAYEHVWAHWAALEQEQEQEQEQQPHQQQLEDGSDEEADRVECKESAERTQVQWSVLSQPTSRKRSRRNEQPQAKMDLEFVAGDRVLVLFQRPRKWFAGTVVARRTNLLLGVRFDDGDFEEIDSKKVRVKRETAGCSAVTSQQGVPKITVHKRNRTTATRAAAPESPREYLDLTQPQCADNTDDDEATEEEDEATVVASAIRRPHVGDIPVGTVEESEDPTAAAPPSLTEPQQRSIRDLLDMLRSLGQRGEDAIRALEDDAQSKEFTCDITMTVCEQPVYIKEQMFVDDTVAAGRKHWEQRVLAEHMWNVHVGKPNGVAEDPHCNQLTHGPRHRGHECPRNLRTSAENVGPWLPCCCSRYEQFMAKLGDPAKSPLEPATGVAARIHKRLTDMVEELSGAGVVGDVCAGGEVGVVYERDTADATVAVRSATKISALLPGPAEILLIPRKTYVGQVDWHVQVCEDCGHPRCDDRRATPHMCSFRVDRLGCHAKVEVQTLLRAFRAEHPPQEERHRGWEANALKRFRKKHCSQNLLGLSDKLWRFFLKGKFVNTAVEGEAAETWVRDGEELLIGAIPGVSPGMQVNSRIECDLLRLHNRHMDGIAYVADCTGAVQAAVYPCTAICTKAGLGANRVQYGDSWDAEAAGGTLDYAGAGGNDTGYTKEQHGQQNFDIKTTAGKANTAMKEAGSYKTPIRVIQQVQDEGGRCMYEYKGLYNVTAARYAYALRPGQSLQRFDTCVNPVCRRKRLTLGLECKLEAHRWSKPQRQIRFTLEQLPPPLP